MRLRDEEVAVLALIGLALLKPKAQPPPPPPPEGEGWLVCVAYSGGLPLESPELERLMSLKVAEYASREPPPSTYQGEYWTSQSGVIYWWNYVRGEYMIYGTTDALRFRIRDEVYAQYGAQYGREVNASVTVTPIPEPYEYWKVVLANLVTPLSIPLKSGTYTIRATYAGRTQSQSVTITANRSTLVVFTF